MLAKYAMTFLVFSVLPAPDSPVTRMDWFLPVMNFAIFVFTRFYFWVLSKLFKVVTMVDHALIGSICYCKDVRWHLKRFISASNTENILQEKCEWTNTCQQWLPRFSAFQSRSWRQWRCRWGTSCTGWWPRRRDRSRCRSTCSHILKRRIEEDNYILLFFSVLCHISK